MVDGSEEGECCAICFQERPFVALPCACRVNYCAECWDRALATSVSVRGRAQCPSCRATLRVDFNPDRGGLVFSKDSDATASSKWRHQLYAKTRPMQVGLLRSFGELLASRTTGEASSGSADGSTSADSADESRSSSAPSAEAEECASAEGVGQGLGKLPRCVCGSHLEHVSSKDRIIRMLEEVDTSWRSRIETIDIDAFSSLVTCDICERVATRSGSLWTCTRGTHTVLHPASYDVCERCFAQHAGQAAVALCEGRGQQSTGCGPSLESCSYYQVCTSTVLSALPWRWCWSSSTTPAPVAAASSSSTRPVSIMESLVMGTC
mmetsp:Transcript_12331/g.33787  ORF Transcript_12331/g.33787 Transcript_12331/m.33787 type:complete len:322 (-) Transcript_12331:50-1015(-)